MSRISSKLRLGACAFLALVLWLPVAQADDHQGTAEEAQAMVAEAIYYFDEVGEEKALAKFNNDPAPMFLDGDLYIFVWNVGGEIVAHAVNQSLVGQNGRDIEDVDGKKFGEEMLEVAGMDGAWVDYKWEDPTTGKVEPKSSWVVYHDGFIFGVGTYKP